MPAESVIERLRMLEERATPGPWKARQWLRQRHTFSEIQEASDGCTVIRESSNQNAALIVTMRNALPLLLRVAEAAEKAASILDKGFKEQGR